MRWLLDSGESVSRCFLNEKAFSVIVKTCAKIRWSVDGVVNVLMCNVVCNLITRVLCLLSIPHTNNNSRLYLHYSSSQPKLNRNTLHLYYHTTIKVLLYKRRSSYSLLLLSSVSSALCQVGSVSDQLTVDIKIPQFHLFHCRHVGCICNSICHCR